MVHLVLLWLPKDIDLAISEVTNPVELGLRDKLTLDPTDLPRLRKKLERHVKKSELYVGKLQDSAKDLESLWQKQATVKLKGRSHAEVTKYVQSSVASGLAALASVPKILDALSGLHRVCDL